MAALRNFVDYDLAQSNRVDAAWLNRVDRLINQTYITVTSFAELQAGVTAAAGEEVIIYLSETIAITDNYTTPLNIILGVAADGVDLVITLNKTLTILRQPIWPRMKIFTFDPNYTFTSTYPATSPGTFNMPVTFARGVSAFPEWFGAKGDGVTDDRVAIQAAQDSLWQVGTLDFDGKEYMIDSVGRRSWDDDLCGIWSTNDYNAGGHTAEPSDRPNVVWKGKGYYNTIITCNNSLAIDILVALYYNGQGSRVIDMSFNVHVESGDTKDKIGLQLAGNGITYERLGTGGCNEGIQLYGATVITAGSDCWDEFSTVGLHLRECSALSVYGPVPLSSDAAQLKITNTVAGMGAISANKQFGPIKILAPTPINGATEGTCILIDVEYTTRVGVELIGSSMGSNNLQAGLAGGYHIAVTKCYLLSTLGGSAWHVKYGTTLGPGNYRFVGVDFTEIGMYDQTAPFASRVIDLGAASGTLSVISCMFVSNAGIAIRSMADNNIIIGNQLVDNANGGLNASNLRAGVTNATVGADVIRIIPQAASTKLLLVDNYLYGAAAEKTGKVGIHLDCTTAVPDAGNVTITGNKVDTNSFEFPLKLTNVTAAQRNSWHIYRDQLAADSPAPVPSVAKAALAAAPTGSMVYVTDETGGAVPAFYDGTDWRRVTDRSVVA